MQSLHKVGLSLFQYPKTLIFLFSVIFLGFIQFSIPGFASYDDPYYHAKHAASYISGEAVSMPVFTSLHAPGADLYPLYHIVVSPFTIFFQGTHFEALIIGTKIFHILIAALIIVCSFEIISFLLKTETSLPQEKITSYALFGSLAILALNFNFLFRLLLARPHLLFLLGLLIIFYCTIRKKYLALALVVTALPFIYTVSFLAIIPVLVYSLCYILYYKKSLFTIQPYIPLFITVFCLIVGILFRPDRGFYLFNAFWVHLRVIADSFLRTTTHTFIPTELLPYPFSIQFDALWLIPYALCIGYFFIKIIQEKNLQTFSFLSFYTTLLSFVFFILLIKTTVTIQYFFPFAVCTVIIICTKLNQHQIIREFVPDMVRFKKIIVFLFLLFIIFEGYFFTRYLQQQPPYDHYKNALMYMSDHSNTGDIVFIPSFGMYPQAVFFNSKNQFTFGIESGFTYASNPHTYSLWQDMLQGNTKDVYTILQQEFSARYVFIDTHLSSDNFIKNISSDSRFKKVYTDPNYPYIAVFEL
jgi:hypothetical protein